MAADNTLVIDYSQEDTLYIHDDTLKLFTSHIDTDSMYRKVHVCYKARVYREDLQAVCDSLVFSTEDPRMTMYQNLII